MAISVFGHAYNSDFGMYCNDVLEFAKLHQKPVMIAESSPIKGITSSDSEVWENWLLNLFTFVYSKNVKVLCFINENLQELEIDGINEWKDARLNNNDLVSKAWFKETAKDKYLKADENLFEILSFSKK